MKDSDILRAASEVIKNGFTKDAYARLPSECSASPTDPEATKFCMLGAVMRAMGNDVVSSADDVVTKWVVPLLPKRTVHKTAMPGSARIWNDLPERTQEHVVTVLNMAADFAKNMDQ